MARPLGCAKRLAQSMVVLIFLIGVHVCGNANENSSQIFELNQTSDYDQWVRNVPDEPSVVKVPWKQRRHRFQNVSLHYRNTSKESHTYHEEAASFGNKSKESKLGTNTRRPNTKHRLSARRKKQNSYKTVLMVLGYVILVAIILASIFRKKVSSAIKSIWRGKTRNSNNNVEAFLKTHQFPGPKRYSYSEVKKMTNNFTDKLGQGGYGSVFKGNLEDGRPVAVKRLLQSKGSIGQDFINEITTIGATNHTNIVTLLGFCSKGSKRALVYDFMPNGSLDRFIFTRRNTDKNMLTMQNLLNISLGVARGLEYLHTGCSNHILHLDIKPQNILLDHDLCPKISDFGLAKLCSTNTTDDSSIEVVARGTRGYIAPELFLESSGRLSQKADVYSFGMMMLEMVGGRKNLEPNVEIRSQIYYPHWIYKHMKEVDKFCSVDHRDQVEELETAKKMIMVGLWSIQIDPDHRPSMSNIVKMLEGGVDDLPLPPNPFGCTISTSTSSTETP